MNTPQTKTVTIVEAEQYDDGFPPTTLLDFNAWLQAHIASIPPEYRSRAEILFDSRESYGDAIYVTVCISYERPETPEELAERIQGSRQAIAEKALRERLLYEQLKAKYEPLENPPEEPLVS